jgi:Contact-dependent growth inhibition CdiA C-terminal domain
VGVKVKIISIKITTKLMIETPNNYQLIYGDVNSDGFVYLHPDQNKMEKTHNSFVGVFLAKLGYKVWLLPLSDLPNIRTADAWIEEENLKIEFKHCQTPTSSAIDKAIQKAKKQAEYILLHIDCEITLSNLIDGVENRTQRPENVLAIKEVWLIYQEKLYIFSREEIITKSWRKALEIE